MDPLEREKSSSGVVFVKVIDCRNKQFHDQTESAAAVAQLFNLPPCDAAMVAWGRDPDRKSSGFSVDRAHKLGTE